VTLYSAYHLRKTSNALVTLVETEQDCLKELFKTVKTVRTTRRIYKVRQVTSSRRSDQRSRKPDGRTCQVDSEVREVVNAC